MKSTIKQFQIESNQQVSDYIYDETTQQFIISATNQIITYHPTTGKNCIPLQTNISNLIQENSQESISQPIHNVVLRFSPSLSEKQLYFTPSCLTVTSIVSDERIAIVNTILEKGSTYLEFICPNNCQDVQFGVLLITNPLSPINRKNLILQNFRTTTPRTIGILIDLDNLEIKFWLNGNFKEKKSKKINQGSYYPVIQLKEKGNNIVLNPYLQTPPEILNKNILPLVQIPDQSLKIQERLKNIIRESQNPKVNQNDIEDEKGSKIKLFQTQNRNLIILKENKIKLIRPNFSMQYDLNRMMLQNKPVLPSDNVTIYISEQELQDLLDYEFQTLPEDVVNNFFDTLQKSLEKSPNQAQLQITASYSILHQFFHQFYEKQNQQLLISSHKYQLLEEKFYRSLQITFRILEQMNGMTLHSEISTQLQSIKKSNQYSSFFRLSSLIGNFFTQIFQIGYANTKYNLYQVSENGVLNQGDIYTKLRHVNSSNTGINEIQNSFSNEELSLQINNQIPHDRISKGWPYPNTNLDTTINSIPYSIHQQERALKIINKYKKSNQMCLLGKNGTITIWQCELALIKYLQANFKIPQKEKQSYKIFQKFFMEEKELQELGIQDEEIEVIASNLLELEVSNMEIVEQEKKLVEEVIVPDPKIVEQLYSMGFPLEIAKKAVIYTKNQGVAQALDIVFTVQQKEGSIQQVQEQVIKQEWTCPVCTLNNVNGVKSCDVCGTLAPVDAFVSNKQILKDQVERQQQEELLIQAKKQEEEEKQKEHQKESVEELKEQLESKEEINPWGSSQALAGLFIYSDKKLIPIVAGVALNGEQNTLFRIRRFGYSYEYMKRFLCKSENSLICTLNGEQFTSLSQQNIEQILLENEHCKCIIDNLEPIFVGNQRYKNIKDYKEDLFNIDFKCFEETEILLEGVKVLDSAHTQVMDESTKNREVYLIILLVQTQNTQYKIQFLKLIIDNNNIKNVKGLPEVNTLDILQIKSFQLLGFEISDLDNSIFILEKQVVVVSNNKLFKFSTDIINESDIETQDLQGNIAQANLLETNKIGILTLSGDLQIFEIEQNKIDNNQEQTTLQQNPQDFSINISQLSAQEINSFTKILNKDFIGVIPHGAVNGTQFSSKQGLYSKYRWNSDNQKLKVDLQTKQHILEINFELEIVQQMKIDRPKSEDSVVNHEEVDISRADQALPLFNFSENSESQEIKKNNFIPLQVQHSTGSAYGVNFFLSKMLCKNESLFVTNYSNSSFTFSHLQEKMMIIDTCTIHSPLSQTQGQFPIGSGLIFTSDSLNFFGISEIFDKMQHEDYLKWLEERKQYPQRPLEQWEPVGCFSFKDNKSQYLTFNLDHKRIAKYIHLLPTSFRSNQQKFESEPLAIKFFGCTGVILDSEQLTLSNNQQSNQTNNIKDIAEDWWNNIIIEFTTNGDDWHVIPNLQDNCKISMDFTGLQLPSVQSQSIDKTISSLIQNKQSFSQRVNIQFSHQLLKQNQISSIRAQWKDSIHLSSVQLQVFVESQINSSQNKILRSHLIDTVHYPKINQQFVNLICDENSKIQQRKSAQTVLSILMNIQPKLIPFIYKDLNLEKYIVLNIFQERNSSFIETLQFLNSFINCSGFVYSLQKVVYHLLSHLTENYKITPVGLNGFISLVNWCLFFESNEAFSIILNQIHEISLKIEKLRISQYNLLKGKYKIPNLVFEKELFSDIIVSKISTSKVSNPLQENRKSFLQEQKPITCKYIIQLQASNISKKYTIDLMSTHNIKNILLCFEKSQQTVYPKFKVQIWKVLSHGGKTLIYNKLYSQSHFIQLSNYSYSPENQIYPEGEKINCLGFGSANFDSRYIIIQISFSQQPEIPHNLELKQVAQNEITPLIYGDEIIGDQSSQIDQINNLFVKNVTFKKELNYSSILYYDVYTTNFPNEIIYDSTNSYKNNKPITESIAVEQIIHVVQTSQVEELKEILQNLQGQLSSQLALNRQSNTMTGVEELVKNIEVIQLQILESSGESFVDISSNLDYLYTLAIKFSQILRKIDDKQIQQKNNLTLWRNNPDLQHERGNTIATNLFHTFVAHEPEGPISEEITQLLSDLLIDNFPEDKWKSFIFQIIQTYLVEPINFKTTNLSNIYSQMKIIQSLIQISIPFGEVLDYLQKSLQLDQNQNSYKNQSSLTLLTSILILLNIGYRRIPSQKLQSKKIVHVGAYCFNCGAPSNQFISGIRYKCVNCPNLNSCENCQSKHHIKFPQHVYAVIPFILPPNSDIKEIFPQPLIEEPFEQIYPSTDIHNIPCDKCNKMIQGTLYWCSNCEEYKICNVCFEDKNHTENHIFLQINKALQVKEQIQTPNALIKLLDPQLYPIKAFTEQAIELPQLSKKMSRGMSREMEMNHLDHFVQSTDNLARLDHQESMKVVFKLLDWICFNHLFTETDKIHTMHLAFDLLMEILRLSTMLQVKEMLIFITSQEGIQNLFYRLFFGVLKMGSVGLNSKLKDFLNSIIFAKQEEFTGTSEETQSLIKEKEANTYSKIVVLYHLHILLEYTINFAVEQDQKEDTIYVNIMKPITNNMWIDHSSFILNYLISTQQKVSKDIKETQDQLRRKSSLSIKRGSSRIKQTDQYEIQIQEEKNTLDEFVKYCYQEKQITLSHQMSKILVNLLLPSCLQKIQVKVGFSFSESPAAWGLVLKSVLDMKVTNLIESEVFSTLVEAFLNAQYEVQQTMIMEILQLTQNLMNQNQHQLSNEILTIIFKSILDWDEDKSDSILYNLLQGWLDILITKTTPKPEFFYTKPLEKSFCQLSNFVIQNLLINSSKFLSSYLNLGGKEGAQICAEHVLKIMNIADDLFNLLNYSETINNQKQIIVFLSDYNTFDEQLKGQIELAFQQLINWYLLNKTQEVGQSPSTDMIKKCSDHVLYLFNIIADNKDICKLCLKELITSCKLIDKVLLKLYKNRNLSAYTTLAYNQKNCQILQELFDLWINSDEIAEDLTFKFQGFEYLLDRMGLNKTDIHPQKEQNHEKSYLHDTDLIQFIASQKTYLLKQVDKDQDNNPQNFGNMVEIKKESEVDNSKIIKIDKIFPKNLNEIAQTLEDMKDEECANKLKVINLPSQNWPTVTPDWSVNQKGHKSSKILWAQFSGQFYNEYLVVIEIDRTIELKQIKLGFNTVWTDNNDKVLGIPQSVLIEGGIDMNSFQPLGTMTLINDEGYSHFGVKVFTKNFQTIVSDQIDIESSLKSLSSSRINFIRFKLRRPVVTFIEGSSMLQGKSYKNVAFSVSFLSIRGYSVAKIPSKFRQTIINQQELSAIQVIGKLCDCRFVNTIKQLANNVSIIEKLKKSFEEISNLMVRQEQYLAPVIQAIAHNNRQMGDWIIDNFLHLSKSEQHAKILTEIIMNDTPVSYERVKKLLCFILKEISNLKSEDSYLKLTQLVPFIQSFTICIRITSSDYRTNQQDTLKLIIDYQQDDICNLIQLFDQTHSQPYYKIIISLFVALLYLPIPYMCTHELLNYTLDKLWELSQSDINKFHYLELISYIIIGSQLGIEWILKDGKLEFLMNDTFQTLQKSELKSKKKIKNLFMLLKTLSLNDKIKEIIKEKKWHLQIYLSIKQNDPNSNLFIQPLIEEETLRLIIEFIKNCVIDSYDDMFALAKNFKDDLSILSVKKDFIFVTEVFVPLLNAQKVIPLCFNTYDSINRRWLLHPKKILLYQTKDSNLLENVMKKEDQEQILPKSLKSTILQNNEKEILLKKINNIYKESNQKLTQFELVASSEEDGQLSLQEIVKTKVLQQPPYLIVLEGINAGNRCVVGVFCTTQLQKQPNFEYQEQEIKLDISNYQIPNDKDCFMYYYEDNFQLHSKFKGKMIGNLLYYEQDIGNGLIFKFNEYMEVIHISFSGQTQIDINVQEMQPLDDKDIPNDIPVDFIFKKIEYWTFQKQQKNKGLLKEQACQQYIQNDSNNLISENFCNNNSPLNFYRAAPLYFIPENITVKKLKEILQIKGFQLNESTVNNLIITQRQNQQKLENDNFLMDNFNPLSNNGIIDLEIDALQLFQNAVYTGSQQQIEINYQPDLQLFHAFEDCGGIIQLIELLLKSFDTWKNQDRAKKWLQFIQELNSFANLPNYLYLFMKNREVIILLFQLLFAIPDEVPQLQTAQTELTEEEKKNKKSKKEQPLTQPQTQESTNPLNSLVKVVKQWEEEEQKAVKYCYQTLSEVFRIDNDSKIRDLALQQDFVVRILDRINLISKEGKRKWVDQIEEVIENAPNLQLEKNQSNEERKFTKKKGVGYASDNTGANSKWNANLYIENKKQMNEQLLNLIAILETFLDFKDWEPPKQLLNQICESCLLPLLESNFRGGALLEMSKESDLVFSYIRLVKVMAKHNSLIPCLLNIDPHYVPKQLESIFQLLKNLKDTSKIFIQCLAGNTQQQKTEENINQQISEQLAIAIIDLYDFLEEAAANYKDQFSDDEEDFNEILLLPLAKKYVILLKDFRYDYVSMKDSTGKYAHHYASYIQPNYTPPQAKMIRLAQELADLSTALPIEHTNSIFVRCDSDRVDVMKVMIMGYFKNFKQNRSSGTPYAHGAFIYDVYFEDTYPNVSPKVNLSTTGGGKVRFNPNLYSCGKVCLSLLGTWRGNASENWDPKLSTLLQCVVSLQAIIMSDLIYFNEPGFEGEQGTEEGERKNEAYSNIVRYCNIQYAMIDQIKNPPKGFETVVKRHFYIKKEEILKECQKWIKMANYEASYNGLVADHNQNWSSDFKSTKTKYKEMLIEAVKELEIQLDKLTPPHPKDQKQAQKKIKKKQKKEKKVDFNQNKQNIENIDVSYSDNQVIGKELDFQDDKVKDRMSRYIAAIGKEAAEKQSKCSIFLSGLGALGVEIAKNIVMTGVKRFTIHDSKNVTNLDLSGQFYLNESDIGKNRVMACLFKIRELNYGVKCDVCQLGELLPLIETEIDSQLQLKNYDVVILTESNLDEQIAIDNYCRKNNIKFICANTQGPFAYLFNDFGPEFEVIDKNGEEPTLVMLSAISIEENGIVKLLPGAKHPFEDGDYVLIKEVEGMIDSQQKSINDQVFKISTINTNSFYIGDTRNYTPYIRNGTAINLKKPTKINFQSLEKCKNEPLFDQNMVIHDFMKMEQAKILQICFMTLDTFFQKNKRVPSSWNLQDCEEFVKISDNFSKQYFEAPNQTLQRYLRIFSFTCQGQFHPLNAFFGGFVSQEIIKAVTNKYMPVNQFFLTDCIEVVPDLPDKLEEWPQFIKDQKLSEPINHNRNEALQIVVGDKLLKEIQYCKLFMIGCGAIGCELLKNFAMISLATGQEDHQQKGGMITITDPDHIETSNLNRQFLFREKHLRMPKSLTATASIIQMNPHLKNHIIAREDKVHDGTLHIYSDKFFESLTIVANALDNVQARRYVDMRCVSAKKPLLESGTLGSKGHVQVIIPNQTESYGSQEDPQEEGEIPHCTLKMFPEETLHCVEWARDKFGKLFITRIKTTNQILQQQDYIPSDAGQIRQLTETIKLLKNRPKNFEDCIDFAVKKFYKYFRNDIKQLLYTYPLDTKTKDGEPFWKLPKRPPQDIYFDKNNKLHQLFVTSIAYMRAKIFSIPYSNDIRTPEQREKISLIAQKTQIPDFVHSDQKAKSISSEVEKAKEESKEEYQMVVEPKQNETENLLIQFKQIIKELELKEGQDFLKVEEFEKDEDSNGHIDLIYSMANCRSNNYKLTEMDWLTVKVKAGRIVPAMATTTACIAGLQSIELVKLLKNEKLVNMKNAFLNLAVPIMQLTEPGAAKKTKLEEGLEVTLWDRWNVKLGEKVILQDLFGYLQNTYKLICCDFLFGAKVIYSSVVMNIPGKEKQKTQYLESKIFDLLDLDKEDEYADVKVTFKKTEDDENYLEGTPMIRIYFQ